MQKLLNLREVPALLLQMNVVKGSSMMYAKDKLEFRTKQTVSFESSLKG